MMNKAANTNLSELERAIYEARCATRVVLTFATLFDVAAMASDGGSAQHSKFPALVELAEIWGQLALKAEDAITSVDDRFHDYERSIR